MGKINQFSCYIVGDNNVALQCAEIIVSAKHLLLGLISPSMEIKKWCVANKIPYIESVKEFEKMEVQGEFDFLFSIVNSEILSKNILNYPRRCAINYHDSPLPKYAGLHATSWAILNGEKQHAITWHVMAEVIDAGDILKQPFFPIDDSDTALSLNLKCYEQAIQSFRELVDELSNNKTTVIKQDLSWRSYYGLKDKPSNLGFISWDKSADDIDRLCRALTFGNYTNQLAIPKIQINGKIFAVKLHKKLSLSSGAKPGTITSISNECIQVATGTFDIAIFELCDMNGKEYPIKNLVDFFKLEVNSQLDDVKNEFLEKLLNSSINSRKREKFWVNKFLRYDVEEVSFLSKLDKFEDKENGEITKIPDELLGKLKKICVRDESIGDVLLASILIYLYRLNNYKNVLVEFSDLDLRLSVDGMDEYLSGHIPLIMNFDMDMTCLNALEVVSKEKEQFSENYTYPRDISIRYPQLNNSIFDSEISVKFVDSEEIKSIENSKKINITVSTDGSWFRFNDKVNAGFYSRSYFFLKNMSSDFLEFLEKISNGFDKKLFELPVISGIEKKNVMRVWNNTNAKYDVKKPLHLYFEEQVNRVPNSIAAVFEDKSISYQTLNQQANKLANYLRKEGIRPDDLVGIFLERSLEMVVCIFGILKAGGAYLPLDPNYPSDRISYMLNDSKTTLLLVDQESIKRKPNEYHGRIVQVESVLNSKKLAVENLEIINKPLNLAYVIYTSGTTGKPKGVAIPHRAICNHMLWMRKEYDYQQTDVFLQKTPFSFDASVWEFFMPLMVGAKLVIAPNDAHASPVQMIQLIKKNKVSVLQLVPSMLKELVSTNGFDSCKSLKHVFCGGEALLPETINTFFKRNISGVKLHNLYGPTEVTIDAASLTCTEDDGKSDVSRIGKPIMNTKAYVLDDKMQLVPVGIVGELYLSGDGLARGYLHNSEFTQQKFVPNPFSRKKNDRLYKTGDLVKWQSDGNLEYIGRRDGQVKIRGFRIEVNEIEANLEKIPVIRQSVVISERNPDDSMSLSAYIVLEENSQISATDIRHILKEKIPEYMIPNRFFVVDKLLTTPNGKVNRRILPTSHVKQLVSGQNHVAPSNYNENVLMHIWCSVLKIENLGVHDDFFDLGGNSLSAMKIILLIKDQFSVNLSIRKLFSSPTVAALAREIENQKHGLVGNFVENLIVSFQEKGGKTPLFLIHPVGGSVFWYKHLAKYLEKDQPLYGIQDPGLEKNELVFESIEEMAGAYINAIQTIQPHGPYLLGGASFGSTVAIEMARQLQERSETVKSLISFDGWAFYPMLQNSEAYFQDIMREQNSRILKKYIKNNICNSEFLLELQWHREKMLMQYKLPVIKEKLILFKAKERTKLFDYDAPLNWWENYSTQPVELHLVPGNHESMFYDPNIGILADELSRVLDGLNAESFGLGKVVCLEQKGLQKLG